MSEVPNTNIPNDLWIYLSNVLFCFRILSETFSMFVCRKMFHALNFSDFCTQNIRSKNLTEECTSAPAMPLSTAYYLHSPYNWKQNYHNPHTRQLFWLPTQFWMKSIFFHSNEFIFQFKRNFNEFISKAVD